MFSSDRIYFEDHSNDEFDHIIYNFSFLFLNGLLATFFPLLFIKYLFAIPRLIIDKLDVNTSKQKEMLKYIENNDSTYKYAGLAVKVRVMGFICICMFLLASCLLSLSYVCGADCDGHDNQLGFALIDNRTDHMT